MDGIDKTGDISFTANPSSAATISNINQTTEGATAEVTIAEGATGSIEIEGKLDDNNKAKCTIAVILDVTNVAVDSNLAKVETGSTLNIANCITNKDSIEEFTITAVTGNATKENDTTIKGTGTADGTATVTITGKQSGKTKDITVTVIKAVEPEVGDFVNYSAGKWTQADLIKLGVEFDEKGNITNNGNLYAGSSLPTSSTPYKFGGFAVGESKDQSITPYNNYANTYSGWRILSKNEDENGNKTYNIIHAGTPEGYYHPGAYNSAYKSQYILGGEASASGSSTWGDYSSISQRDWSMYENATYAQANSARSVTYAEMNSLSSSNTLKKTGSYYWLPLAFYSNYLLNVDGNGSICSDNRGNNCFGVRPVVSLKSNVTFTAKSGDTTHTTEETAWQLGTN